MNSDRKNNVRVVIMVSQSKAPHDN